MIVSEEQRAAVRSVIEDPVDGDGYWSCATSKELEFYLNQQTDKICDIFQKENNS